jgi:NADPH-dependent 2,4-dienoyl-CoA reductase/sulfur reductase-like enzyme
VTLDLAERQVVTSDGTTHRYDACVLAPGSVPSPLPVPGGDHPDVLSLRSHADGDRLRSRAGSAESAIVVGSGFIGCEAAVSLAVSGRQVTLLSMETAPQIDRLGAYAADRIRGWLTEQGVSQVFEASVERIDDGRTVVLDEGSTFSADLVLGAVGVTPQSRLARAAGLTIEDDRIRTDAALRTSDAHVWSAGDAALAHNTTAQRSLRVEHWGEALAMGEIAGHNAADGSELRTWSTVPGFWTEIGSRVLKFAAWGDGFDRADPVDHGGGAFSVWYSREGACVGVLTHDTDDDYERGREIVASGQAAPV